MPVSLPPLEPFQQQMIDLMPLADALAERIITTLAIDADPFGVGEATDVLHHHMMQTTHKLKHPTNDEDRDLNQASAQSDAALMIGYPLGRRIGGGR